MPPPRPQPTVPASNSMPYGASEQLIHPAPLRGRELVINSSVHLLQTFLFFYYRNPAVLICWTMGQQAFNACMILILDALESQQDSNEWLVDQAFAVFVELDRKGVHKLAELAVRRISDGLAQLGMRSQEREQQAAMSRRSSAQRPPTLMLDTASMTDWSNDTIMGNTGSWLLEDPGLQSFVPQSFQPLGWNFAGSAPPSNQSNPPVPDILSTIPVSQVTAAPFPVMSPPFVSTAMPVTNSPYAVGLQPRMPNTQHRPTGARHPQQLHGLPLHQQPHGISSGQQVAFTPINPAAMPQSMPSQQPQRQQQPFSQVRGPRHSQLGSHSSSSAGTGGGPRGVHKLDRPPGGKSAQRRK